MPAGIEVTVTLTYSHIVPVEGGKQPLYRLVVPTIVGSRYVAAKPHPNEANGERAAHVAPGFSVRVEVCCQRSLLDCRSPSHAATTVTRRTGAGPNTFTASLFSSHAPAGDFVLEVCMKPAIAGCSFPGVAWVQAPTPSSAGAAMASFVVDEAALHRLDEEDARHVRNVHGASTFVFVVDRSGSMGGSRMRHAITAMQVALRSLPQGCKFQVLGFGSSVQSLFPHPVAYNDETLAAATHWVAGMTANLGRRASFWLSVTTFFSVLIARACFPQVAQRSWLRSSKPSWLLAPCLMMACAP